jgi:hypothetical protein
MPTQIGGLVQEASDYEFYATLVGEDGQTALDVALVDALTASLRDGLTGTVLWHERNILNTNGGALIPAVTSRNFTLQLTPADTVSLSGRAYQPRVLTVHVVHSGGKQHHQAFTFMVENLSEVGGVGRLNHKGETA